MTDAPHEPTDEQLRTTAKTVADKALRSDQSWDILTAMYQECARQVMSTQSFTVPIMTNESRLRESLTDADGFFESYRTFVNDLREYSDRLKELVSRHKDRTGEPDPVDWPVIFEISQEYSDLMDRFETVIKPLALSLMDILSQECPDLVTTQHAQEQPNE